MGSAAGAQHEGPPTAEEIDAVRKQWPVGSLCVISGLQSASAQPLNGHLAEVRGIDEKAGRMCLRLNPKDEPSKWKKVKPQHVKAYLSAVSATDAECNFCFCSGDDALVKPCLCRGSSEGVHLKCLLDAYEARTEERIEYPACPTCRHTYDGSLALMLLQPKQAALERSLQPGSMVVIEGLTNAAHLNGLNAALLEYDSGTKRWKVQLESGDIKAVRCENLFWRSSLFDEAMQVNLLRCLGIAYSSASQPANGVGLLEKAVRIEERIYGGEELELAVPLTNLGIVYNQLEQAEKALQVLERALSIKERSLDAERMDLVPTLSNLAAAKILLGEYRRAMEMLERAQEMSERTLGKDHADMLPTLLHLSTVCRKLGQNERAVGILEHALKLQERELGANHHHLAPTLVDLSSAYGAVKKHNSQISALKRALAITEAGVGKHHPALLPLLQDLEVAHRAMVEDEKALSGQDVHSNSQ